jgi:hypothetical protein
MSSRRAAILRVIAEELGDGNICNQPNHHPSAAKADLRNDDYGGAEAPLLQKAWLQPRGLAMGTDAAGQEEHASGGLSYNNCDVYAENMPAGGVGFTGFKKAWLRPRGLAMGSVARSGTAGLRG